MLGVFEGVANDLFGAGVGNDLERRGSLLGLAVLDAAVGVFLVLADNDDVHDRVLGLDERGVGDAGADVGEQPERFAGGDIEALVAAALGRGDGGFQGRLCCAGAIRTLRGAMPAELPAR